MRPPNRYTYRYTHEKLPEWKQAVRLEPQPHQQLVRVRPGGLEPPAFGSEVRRSIQLSYGRGWEQKLYRSTPRTTRRVLAVAQSRGGDSPRSGSRGGHSVGPLAKDATRETRPPAPT